MDKNVTMVFEGKTYNRELENLGEVEMIKWYNESNSEIYDEELLHDLENHFETIIVSIITPSTPII